MQSLPPDLQVMVRLFILYLVFFYIVFMFSLIHSPSPFLIQNRDNLLTLAWHNQTRPDKNTTICILFNNKLDVYDIVSPLLA